MNGGSTKTGAVNGFMKAVDRLIPEKRGDFGDVEEWTLDEPFDKQGFLDRMLGDIQLAGEIAGLFLSHNQEPLAAIGGAVRAKNLAALSAGVQSLRGTVSSFGAAGVLDCLRELDKTGQAGDWASAAKAFEELERQVSLLSRSLEAIWGAKKPWRILIADDDPVSRRLLQATLTKWGHESVVCVDGTQALSALQKNDAPKIAILDWMMPGLDGVQVCREVHKKMQYHAYIILLTGKDRTDDIIEGLDAGADDYLTKPFDPAELRARLRVAFRTMDLLPDTKGEGDLAALKPLRDASTGLLTRSEILVLLKRYIVHAQDEGKTVGVILAQPDQYATVKETHGPAAADTLLRGIGDRIVSLTESQDPAGRYEEDKILVLLPEKGRDQIIEIAQGMRSMVEVGPLAVQGLRIPVKLNIGVTVVTGKSRVPLESVICAAQDALTDAKSHPGQAVRFAPSKGPAEEPPPAPVVQRVAAATSKLDLELIVAARAGNVKRVKGLLDSGADVDARDNRGNTPLIEAAFFKYPDLVQLLLSKGADINARNHAGDTALTEAIRAGHGGVVDLLLSKWNPSSLEEESAKLYRALFEASSYGNTEVVARVRDFLARRGFGRQK
jgi:diguanylate cyclase (GGDEF)-like protein